MARILTLSVGSSKATLAEYNQSGASLTLTAYGSASLLGLDLDADGSAEMVLTPVLRDIMKEHGIKPGPVVISLPGNIVFPRSVKFPPLEGEKLGELIRYEIEQNVPFPIDEIVSDHAYTGEAADGDRSELIVAAKLAQVRQLTSAVQAAGLTVKVVEAAPSALVNSLRTNYPDLDGCNIILDVGGKTTNLVVVEGEKIYNRSIRIAGDTITKELATAFQCSPEEAEQLKIERAYVSQGGVTEDEDEVADNVSKVVRAVCTRLHAELSRSVNFYRSQQGGSAPTRLFLTGGSARLNGLDEFFAETLQIEVAYLNPLDVVKTGPKVDVQTATNDVYILAESLGCAAHLSNPSALKINLLPPELILAERNRKRLPFVAIGGVCLIAALYIAGTLKSNELSVIDAQKSVVADRNSNLSSMTEALEKVQAEYKAELAKADQFQVLCDSRATVVRRLDAVRHSLLNGMWLTEWKPDDKVPNTVYVTVRGWQDLLTKAVEDYNSKVTDPAQKKTAASEIVEAQLKGKSGIVPDQVKLVSQVDIGSHGYLSEYRFKIEFAPAPTVIPAPKAKNMKGARQ